MEAIVMIEEAGKVLFRNCFGRLHSVALSIDRTGRDLFSLVVIVRGVVIFFG